MRSESKNDNKSVRMHTRCNFKFRDLELWYFDPDGLERWGVLAKVLCEDSRKNSNLIKFTKPCGGGVCSHIHCFEPEKGVAIMKVANREVNKNDTEFWNIEKPELNFALVIIVSNEKGRCIFFGQNEHAFRDVNELISIVRDGLNEILKPKKLAIVLDAPIMDNDDDLASVSAAMYVCKQLTKVHNMMKECNMTLTKKKKRIPQTQKPEKTLRAAIVDQTKADVILLKIDNCVVGKTEPKDEMMPITAAYAAKVMRLPTWTELKNTYPNFKLSETSFYRLRQPDCLSYINDTTFGELVEYYKSSKTSK